VTGTIVAVIGISLAPTAVDDAQQQPALAALSLVAVLLATVGLRGFLGRLSILVGVVLGYGLALALGMVDTSRIAAAPWLGVPSFTTPTFTVAAAVAFLPIVLVVVAENVGHVKAVGSMCGQNLDGSIGHALVGDGVATTLAGLGGGSGTTTYAENIGVMAATRIYSSAAYIIAGGFAIALSLSPKVGAVIASIPPGVIGGVSLVLFGMISVLGARMWIQGSVDFGNRVNLLTAALAIVATAGGMVIGLGWSDISGMALGALVAVVAYHALRGISRWRGTWDN
jgi:uracil-xanthine permease